MSFPNSETEALALAYLNQLELNKIKPEEIYSVYAETLEKVKKGKDTFDSKDVGDTNFSTEKWLDKDF